MRYNSGYTSNMKTAISIPDSVFAAAESVAASLSISRSQLYTRAIQEFVDSHSSQKVTEQLDQIYAENDSALDPVLAEMQRKSLKGRSW